MHVSPKENFYSDVFSILKTFGKAAALQHLQNNDRYVRLISEW
jgi:hypothetical protein